MVVVGTKEYAELVLDTNKSISIEAGDTNTQFLPRPKRLKSESEAMNLSKKRGGGKGYLRQTQNPDGQHKLEAVYKLDKAQTLH